MAKHSTSESVSENSNARHFAGLFIDKRIGATALQQCKTAADSFGLNLISTLPDDGLFLIANDSKEGYCLGLCDAQYPKQKPVQAEFTSAEMHFRLKRSGARSELIMRAIGNKSAPWHVIDATPGLGRDAMVMATFGCRVTMLERSPVVAALLSSGLHQLKAINPDIHNRLALHCGNSIDLLNHILLENLNIDLPDVVYLDPMFPHKKKSALVKKEMQVFQRLLGHDEDADNLLLSALKVAKKRVVVKRPNSAQPLNQQKPNMEVNSKKHRFDVYITDPNNIGE